MSAIVICRLHIDFHINNADRDVKTTSESGWTLTTIIAEGFNTVTQRIHDAVVTEFGDGVLISMSELTLERDVLPQDIPTDTPDEDDDFMQIRSHKLDPMNAEDV